MKLGIFSAMDFHPEQQGAAAEFYREVMGLAVAAEDLGYDSVWIAEHHFSDYSVIPSPNLLVASLAQKTKKVRIGTLVNVLPFHHPIRLAEEVAVLDVLTQGRFIFGIGRGCSGMSLPALTSRWQKAARCFRRRWTLS